MMKKLMLGLAISTALGLTGCGGGGGGSSSSSSSDSEINGAASKGIISGGRVEAFLFLNGVPDTTGTPIATATTNSAGKYTLSIPSAHEGKPLFIRISSTSTTTMKCDIAGGCDADGDTTTTTDVTPFGQTITLGEGQLEMTAVVPQASESIAVNITPLTTVAAELAKGEITSGSSDNGIAVAIAKANSQVSTSFNLGPDITKIAVVDLTDAADVAANATSNTTAVNYAAINAAIVKAKQTDSSGAGSSITIGQAVSTFAQEVVSKGGFITKATNAEDTSIEDILTQAVAVLDIVEAEVSDTLDEDSLDQSLSDASSATESTTGELADPSDTSGILGNYAKVKAFVEELRELGVAIDSSLVGEGEGAQTVEAILDGFDAQLDFADTVSSTDAEATFAALGDALNAIIDVYEDNVDEMGVDTIAAGNYTSPDSIPVVVTVNAGVTTLTVNTTLNVEVDEQTLPVTTNVSAVLTSFSFDDNVVETPAEEFDVSTLPGTYDQSGATVIINSNGTGTFTEPGEEASGAFTWAIVEENLVMTWTEGEQVHKDVYELTSGRNMYDAEFEISYYIDDELQEVYNDFWFREGYDGAETAQGTLNGNLDLNIFGELSVGTVELELENGTAQATISGTIDETVTETEEGFIDDYNTEFVLTNILLDVDVRLSQVATPTDSVSVMVAQEIGDQITDPLTFTGGLELSLSRADLEEDVFQDETSDEPGSNVQSLNRLGIFGFALNGSVANESGEAFDFLFDLELDGTGVPAYSEIFEETNFGSDKIDTTGGETTSRYVDVDLTLAFSAKLAGITDALDVDFNISRSGYDDVSATLDLSYPGRDISIVAEANNLDSEDEGRGEMTITNVNDGIVIFVDVDDSIEGDDDVSVEIRMDTNADGEVDEDDFLFAQKVTRNGIEMLEYVDQDDPDNIEFESLF